MVDFATDGSQNGFSTYQLTHKQNKTKKNNIIQNITKKYKIFHYFRLCLYSRAVLKQEE
jgi:hypothetical protein